MNSPIQIDPAQLVAAAPVPWCLLDGDVIVMANDALARLTRFSDAQLAGRRLTSLLHPDDRSAVRGRVSGRKAWQLEARGLPTDAATTGPHLMLSAAPLDTAANGSIMLLVATDVTDLLEASAELRILRDQAVALADRQRDFVATVTHELRSPLHAILGLGELVQKGPLSPEQTTLMERLMGAAGRLRQTVDELLDMSRAESGDVPLTAQDVDLRDIVGRVTARLSINGPSADRGVEVVVAVADDVPTTIVSDEYRWDQILTNLIGNAIAYTGQGTVGVHLLMLDPGRIELVVSDDGPGVPLEYREQIFQPFVRVPGAVIGGTGLGLPLVRALARAMSGDIGLHCPDSGGSVFTVTVPVMGRRPDVLSPPTGTSRPPPDSTEEGEGSATVLVVEDTEMIQVLASMQLTRLGHRSVIAGTGALALELISDDPDRFDLVLMDWQLPDADGTDVTRQIRESEAAGARTRIPVIAVTANAMPATRAACLAAGMDDFLTKPVSMGALRRVLKRWFVPDRQARPMTLDAGRLLSLSHDPAAPGAVIGAAAQHLDRVRTDLSAIVDAARQGDTARARALVLPHVRALATLGFVTLSTALEDLYASATANALSAASAAIDDAIAQLSELSTQTVGA